MENITDELDYAEHHLERALSQTLSATAMWGEENQHLHIRKRIEELVKGTRSLREYMKKHGWA